MNKDVAIEVLLHLPVRSLLRFRTVCKFWCDVIDSLRFRELHTKLRNNNNDDNNDDKADAVYLQFTLLNNRGNLKISTKLLENGKSLESHDLPSFDQNRINVVYADNRLKVAGAVKGLICTSTFPDGCNLTISICNPFLGQFKILPLSPYSPCHLCGRILCHQQVGVGFDEDYKVVQLLACNSCHRCIQAYLYSRRTNSWRKLALDQELFMHRPIKSLCKNGSFAHWIGWRGGTSIVILSFDMMNEVFRTFTISGQVLESFYMNLEILAKDESSFVLFGLHDEMVRVYESRVEGSELIWTLMRNVEQDVLWNMPLWRSDDFAVFKKRDCVVWWLIDFMDQRVLLLLYDCRAREFIARLELPATSAVVEYEGSFISP